GTYQKIEDKFVDTFLDHEEAADNAEGETAEKESKVKNAFEKIEDAVVGTYQKIEDGVVGTYQKIEDKFVDTFMEKVEPETEEVKEDTAEENKTEA
ncbi:MAG: hypothetical protein J6A39_04140, partial [Peptococcaceae bacterium]|nr:hypothetical protein [Peptococcaceae bacterium]